MALARKTAIAPSEVNDLLERAGTTPIEEPVRLSELAARPEVPLRGLFDSAGLDADAGALAWAEVEFRYGGYIEREREAAARLAELEEFAIPTDLAFDGLVGLSIEAREKLARQRPTSLGQAGRIPGVSPSDLQSLVLAVIKARRVASGTLPEPLLG